MNDRFKLGDSKAVCDRCGWHKYQSELRKEWTGAMVCSLCFDSRHPQDNIKIRGERNNIRNPRPEQEYRFLAVGEITGDDL